LFVETDRLILRKPVLKDFDEYWLMKNDGSTTKFTGGITPYGYDERLEMFRIEWVESDQKTELSITIKTSGKYIGYCGIIDDNELLYGLIKSEWGNGYSTEAAKAMLDYGFNELNLPFVVATVNPENVASEKVLQNIGLSFDCAVKESGILLHKYRIEGSTYLLR